VAPVDAPNVDGSGVRERPSLRRVERYDFSGRLGKFERTPSGGLRIPGFISRVGIQAYVDVAGKTTLEFRPPEEVLAEESWRSFEGAPLTWLHPPDLVDPTNWREYVIGSVRNVRPDGSRIAADFVVEDAAAITAIENDEIVESSAGYKADEDPTPGEYEGQPFDVVQRNIRGNHVALGPAGWGRAGPSVSLRLDAAHQVIGAPASRAKRTDSMTTPKTVKVDGIPYEAGSDSHLQAVDKLLAQKDAALAEQKTRFDAELATARNEHGEAKGTVAALEARATKAEAQVAEAQKKLDAAMSPEELDKRVADRLALIDRARGVLGASFAGKTDKDETMADGDIMRAVLDKVGLDLGDDGKDDSVVRGAFLAATKAGADAGESGDGEDTAEGGAPKGDGGGVRISKADDETKVAPATSVLEQVRRDNAEYLATCHKGFAVTVTKN